MKYAFILKNGKDKVAFIKFSCFEYPDIISKIYFSRERAIETVRLMEDINNKKFPLNSSLPRIYSLKEMDGRIYVEEEFVKGCPMEADAKRTVNWKKYFVKNLEQARFWITALHKEFKFEDRIIKKADVRKCLKEVGKCMDLKFFRNMEIRDYRIPYILSHGDYRPTNIIKKGDKIFVIDWERWNKRGIYLFDLMEFILRYVHSHYMWQRKGIYLNRKIFLKYWNVIYLNENFLTRKIKRNVDFYCNALKIGENERDILLVLWLYKNLYPGREKAWIF